MGLLSTNAIALVAVLSAVLVTSGHSQQTSYDAARSYNSGWLPAKATWYGAPTGAGPDDNGGACGYKFTNLYPFSSMTSCGNEPLFMDGAGCGTCFQIKCTSANNPACSGQPKTVMITDMNYYPVARYHFDLSGTAFGAMANNGQNDQLRHAGIIDMQFRRVACNYPGINVIFHVEAGSNPMYLAVLILFANRDGNVVQMDVMESRYGGPTGYWMPMRRSWGAIWRLDSGHPLQGPFSLRIRSEFGATLVAHQALPADWKPDTNYWSNVQYS